VNNREEVYKSALEYALHKIENNMGELKDSFPFVTVNGKWELCKEEDWDLNIFSNGYWCNGFWIGILWLAYKVTKNDKFKRKAYELCKLIESRKKSNKTHDLGFLFYPSFCVGYVITKDEYLKSVALTAADSLLSRFNDKIDVITAFGDPKESGRTGIDTMMNLPLLWWAYEKTGKQEYYDTACKHATTTMQHIVRENGSTYHGIEFDPMSGQIKKKYTSQGYSAESCWSRGQAWGIYGFVIAYKYTKRKEFLRTAEKLADYYIANCPSDYVPYWDFNDTEIPNALKDSSAAAITASGLVDLSNVEQDKTKAEKYKQMAYSIMESLSRNYLSVGLDSQAGILLHGCFHKPNNIAIDNSLIFGDYYYMEGLIKLITGGVGV